MKTLVVNSRLFIFCISFYLYFFEIRSVLAFSLITPPQPWMLSELGYSDHGWRSGFGLIEHEYRWPIPFITYGFTQEFEDDFGQEGISEVKRAIEWFNLTEADKLVLDNYPLRSESDNFSAAKQNLISFRSAAGTCILEQLGVGNPYRGIFTLNSVKPGIGVMSEQSGNWFYSFGVLSNSVAVVYNRNYDPLSLFPSRYINGELYTFSINDTLGTPFLSTANVSFGVRRRSLASIEYQPGRVAFGLTRDDVGALRHILSRDNLNIEALPDDVESVNPGSGVKSLALRRGVGAYRFVEMERDGAFAWKTQELRFDDVIILEGKNYTQQLKRIVKNPDLLFTSHRARPPSTSGLFVHLPFDYSVKNVASNTNSRSYDPSLENRLTIQRPGFSYTDGVRKRGLRFDGRGFVGRLLADNEESPTSGDFTLSVWVRTATIPASNEWWRILHQGDENPYQGTGVGLVMQPQGSGQPGKVTFELFNKNANQDVRFSSYPSSKNLADGKWHHLLGSFRFGVASFYVDGQLNGSGTTAFTTISNRAPFTVGNIVTIQNGGLRGDVDEVRIYNRALTAQEIRELYTLESGEPQYLVKRSDTTRWRNYSNENGLPGQQGPGVLGFPSVISFSNNPEELYQPGNVSSPEIYDDQGVLLSNPTGAVWGAFDGSTNLPKRIGSAKLAARKILSGLQAYWSADLDGTDSLGRSHLTAEGSAVSTDQGKIGGAFLVPPQGGSWVTSGSDVSSRVTGDFTLSLWARHIDLLSDPLSGRAPVQELVEIGPNQRVVLKVNVVASQGDVLVPGITLSLSGPDGVRDAKSYQLPPINKWYHCAVTYSNKNVAFFVDGRRLSPPFTVSPVPLTRVPANVLSTVRLGGSSGKRMRGFIDEVCVWNRALGDEEIPRIGAIGDLIKAAEPTVSIETINGGATVRLRTVSPFGGNLSILKSEDLINWWTVFRDMDGDGNSRFEENATGVGVYKIDFWR